ncbi:MAG: hypothetical protein JNL21_09665 [Myxococcales bacterium]|nr:hypothetical protein [Myxococcales bacterium]
MIRRSWMVLVGALAASTAGCSASSEFMRPVAAPQPVKPASESAVVVFVRPSGFGGALKQTILDGKGRFLGEALPSSRFSVSMPPGEHTFIVWAENTGAVKASLAAGKVYFVEVALSMGAFSARADLVPINPGSEAWSKLDGWLAETEPFTPDEPGGQAYLAERKEDVDERIRRAKEHLANYDAGELAEHTLGPGDGK